MDISYFTQQMKENANRIQALANGVSIGEARWKPNPNSWSILEVINHLYDEEKEDFRVRLNIILYHSEQAWPPIDPGGWVLERKYNERDLSASIDNFMQERENSLAWLASLEKADWDQVYAAPFGSIRAGDMFTSWVTHDYLHMRQLVELLRGLTLARLSLYRGDYAGPWEPKND